MNKKVSDFEFLDGRVKQLLLDSRKEGLRICPKVACETGYKAESITLIGMAKTIIDLQDEISYLKNELNDLRFEIRDR